MGESCSCGFPQLTRIIMTFTIIFLMAVLFGALAESKPQPDPPLQPSLDGTMSFDVVNKDTDEMCTVTMKIVDEEISITGVHDCRPAQAKQESSCFDDNRQTFSKTVNVY